MNILVTGCAGFIGMHTSLYFSEKHNVIGLDSLNDYYSINYKLARLNNLGFDFSSSPEYNKVFKSKTNKLSFIKLDICDFENLTFLFKSQQIDYVVHLAAQAGVRYSINNPDKYSKSNLEGFFNVLECSRINKVKHFLFASSSSVYGETDQMPFKEDQNTDKPVSFYAATKKSNEVLSHSYSIIYGLKTTALRFFTVYGPWGRPDMAPILFAKAGLDGTPIDVYNNGNQMRDFTYVDDIVKGIDLALFRSDYPNNEIFNIGNGNPVGLMNFIEVLETVFNKKFKINMLPKQDGDVSKTYSDITKLKELGYEPKVRIKEGVKIFAEWFLTHKELL